MWSVAYYQCNKLKCIKSRVYCINFSSLPKLQLLYHSSLFFNNHGIPRRTIKLLKLCCFIYNYIRNSARLAQHTVIVM